MNDNLVLGSPLSFYGGEITLRFCSEKNGKPAHLYYLETPDGYELVKGVTTVCGIIDKSNFLIPWACKMMAEKLLRTFPREDVADGIAEPFQTKTAPVPWPQFVQIVDEAKKAHKEKFEDASDVGTAAHQWIEDSIKVAIEFNAGIVEEMNEVRPADERAVNCGLAAHKWMLSHNVRWICTEKKIYSRKHKYAGTMDGKALVDSCSNPICCPRLFQDEKSLIDWKSSNNLRTEYLYQTASYQAADQEETGEKIDSRWVLRLGKELGDFEAWYERNFEDDFNTFLACLNLQRAHEAVEDHMRVAKKLKTFTKRAEKPIKPKRKKKDA